MKKFVSLVLVLALALSLCTVAMAVGAPKAPYVADEVDGTVLDASLESDSENTVSLEKYSMTTDADKGDVQTYVFYVTTKTSTVNSKAMVPGFGPYILATEDSYDCVFVDGKTITYLYDFTTLATGVAPDKRDVVTTIVPVDDTDDADCKNGKYYSANEDVLYDIEWKVEVTGTKEDGIFKVADDGTTAEALIKVGDKYVGVVAAIETTDYTKPVEHTWLYNSDKSNDKIVVTKIYCKDCGVAPAFVQGTAAEATAKFGAGKYEVAQVGGADLVVNGKTVYIAKTASGAVDAAATTVDSSKTFDAGVAMYVGLSLMSVAGSAVVIGKKKEF